MRVIARGVMRDDPARNNGPGEKSDSERDESNESLGCSAHRRWRFLIDVNLAVTKKKS